jgi:hypothetical protein
VQLAPVFLHRVTVYTANAIKDRVRDKCVHTCRCHTVVTSTAVVLTASTLAAEQAVYHPLLPFLVFAVYTIHAVIPGMEYF